MRDSTAYLRKLKVHRVNTPEVFNLEKYQEKDHSIEKNNAALRGAGDFKTLIKNNMRGRK